MKLAMVPTVASPRSAIQPPAPAMIARKPRLLIKFIIGPMNPEKVSTLVAAHCNLRLETSNSAMAAFSRT